MTTERRANGLTETRRHRDVGQSTCPYKPVDPEVMTRGPATIRSGATRCASPAATPTMGGGFELVALPDGGAFDPARHERIAAPQQSEHTARMVAPRGARRAFVVPRPVKRAGAAAAELLPRGTSTR